MSTIPNPTEAPNLLNFLKRATNMAEAVERGEAKESECHLMFFEYLGLLGASGYSKGVFETLSNLDCLAYRFFPPERFTAYQFLSLAVRHGFILELNPPKNFTYIEAAISNKLSESLSGKREVRCSLGQVDVVTSDEIIEVKRAKLWRHAVRQILGYSIEFPGKYMRIHLFGKFDGDLSKVNQQCLNRGIRVTWEA